MSQRIRRVRSNAESDVKSFIITGNLYEVPTDIESLDLEEDHDSIEFNENVQIDDARICVNSEPCTLEEYNKANRLCEDVYGINLIEIVTKLLLNNDLDVKEFVIQGLAYKAQSLTRGTSGVRYQQSWGLFWAAMRNIVRSRGILGFRDHFNVPSASQLARYQHKIMEVCGLKSETVGRPGIQSKTAELWVNSKKLESGLEAPCLSVAMDAKKIAVTESGLEDLAGLGNSPTNEEEIKAFEKEIKTLEELMKKGERKGLYTVFDSITLASQQLISRTVAVEELLAKNNRLIERNPLLSKYIYVLNKQLAAGLKIIKSARELQSQIISGIADKRNCGFLCPFNGNVDLAAQRNFLPLSDLSAIDDDSNLGAIQQSHTGSILDIDWSNLETQLTRMPGRCSRRTQTFSQLFKICYLSSDTLHASCGLGKLTPLLDMKNAWARAHTLFRNNKLTVPEITTPALTATFCSSVAIMLFGNNCMIQESGIHIKNGICAAPDLLVVSNSGNTDYTVRIVKSSSNIFQISEEDVVTCLADAFICGAEKGAIAVLHNEGTCVAVHIPLDKPIVRRMLTLSDTCIKSNRCIVKRSPAMLSEVKDIKNELVEKICKLTILGCYPVVESVSCQERTERLSSESSVSLRSFMQDVRGYLSKKAKELVAVNVSDLSGNPSKTPHTILGATYLTSSSLKLVGRQCLDEVCAMLTANGAKVINIGVDGESLYLASVLSDGTPGTLQSLIKHVFDKLKTIKKERLVELLVLNPAIDLTEQCGTVSDDEEENIEDLETCIENEDQITEDVLDSAALIENSVIEISKYTIEDVEEMLDGGNVYQDEESVAQRSNIAKTLTLAHLRLLCLRYLIPRAKQVWLKSSIGIESFQIYFNDGDSLKYSPNTVFEKINGQYFRTISFDYAHIINLFREHAAKGRLSNLGLDKQMLEHLSQQPGFEYLNKIIAIKGNKLVFDSMNQKAAAALFSKKTVSGLQILGYNDGAKCVQLISEGLAALDESGIDVKTRILRINSLKMFVEQKTDMAATLKRADNQNMTNELVQMLLTTLDSYMYTSMTMQFFNVRRKGTGSVEQLFGQMMMMIEGCGKLDVRQLQDILKRLTLTNSLRLVPYAARGFKFLSQLKQHMKSYTPDDFEDQDELTDIEYPTFKNISANIYPSDSFFDKQKVRKKRDLHFLRESTPHDTVSGKVRKFHEKFS